MFSRFTDLVRRDESVARFPKENKIKVLTYGLRVVHQMAFDRKNIEKALADALAQKGERKFTQSIDLAINFKDMDFKKAENRINIEMSLPHAPRPVSVAVFADGQLRVDAKKAGAEEIIASAEIDVIAKDKKRQKELLQYSLLAAPQLMVAIGKALGQLLGTKGKLPKPIPPNASLATLISNARRTIGLKSKGKFLPSVHCTVAKENAPTEQIVENIQAVLEAVEKKVSDQNIKSVFIKTTMGKPVKIA